MQFESAFRKLILGACHFGEFENTMTQDDTFIPVAPSTEQNYKFFSEKYDLLDENIQLYVDSLNRTSEFKSLALNYIAGYVQWRLLEKENSDICKDFLSNMKIFNAEALIVKKNRGGLTLPSIEIDKVIKLSEDVFLELLYRNENRFAEKHFIEKVTIQICTKVNSNFPSLFMDLPDHMSTMMGSHQNLLIKKVVECFITLRLKHYLREKKPMYLCAKS